MGIQVEEICTSCHTLVVINLIAVPEPRTRFEYACPHCGKRQKGVFRSYNPHGAVIDAVTGFIYEPSPDSQ